MELHPARGTHVVLRGDVRTSEQARLAEQTARETKGVETVKSQLTMRVPATPPASTTPEEPPAPTLR